MSSTAAAHGHEGAPVSHDRAYWKVFAALGVFTVVELAIPGILGGIRPLMIVLLMLVATTKALLVAAYYMHLKFEQLGLWVMAASPLILVAVLILLIKADINEVDQAGWTFTDHPAAHAESAGH